MLDLNPRLRPVHRPDNYLRLEDLGVIGDGATVALVGVDGSIPWLCLPHFDSDPVLAGLLDNQRGGHFTVTVQDLREARQHYIPDTAVLVTELRSGTGLLQITDAIAVRSGADLTDDAPAGRAELVRSARVLNGTVRLDVDLQPRDGGLTHSAFDGLEIRPSRRPDLRLHLRASRPLTSLPVTFDLQEGEHVDLILSWGRIHRQHRFDADAMLATTADAWRRWMAHFTYSGPQEPLVRRSAITLKLCDDWVNGAMVAAPTSSLPAPIGGVRNWDYRYAWVRDAAFTVFALRRIGFGSEADAFLGWVLDAFERSGQPRIMYTLGGGPVPDEVEDPGLEGYRGSAPVHWGNGAADQRQHDVYGEVLDCADQWVRGGGELQPALWAQLGGLADAAEWAWRDPDQGIWELRNDGRVFTYSAGMCQVALDRAAALGDRLGLPGPTARWRAAATELTRCILERSWDEKAQTLSAHLDGGGVLDASLLALPLRQVIPATHPRMIATTAAVAERLSAGDGLLYRYLHEEAPDGIAGDEGAFVLCSFWLVENLIHQGRLDQAHDLYASLCARTSPLGLLSEQIDPGTGAFIGNFPQAFSHIGIIASGVSLARAAADPTA
ncbi:glycoside hydrolase family 15 protein [Micromonospora eburnea]|uniref:Glucoamylase (Glucan-1,4-alpha-glucosidase), GH15 family n=1 Tax=Micromonospora eburnea TaxID=227316 RepID=A0A1C6VC97_9ACTN|nr:glycoside hydrolase family 15 protein [Micromonospora eburnea]SCL63973.1 Glucoamylase (glucan-1,4-alpha-glucosidase), GH15 family [Micromonospora eburnea]